MAGAWLSVCAPVALLAQDVSVQPPPIVRSIDISGAKEVTDDAVRRSLGLQPGQPLPDTPDRLADRIAQHYRDEGYTFARVVPQFDPASGALQFAIDEGVIDGVEFQGIDETLAQRFAAEFAMRAGDVFNRRKARQALDVLLRQTRGAVSPGHVHPTTITDSDDLRNRRGAFDLVDQSGRRILVVGLREPGARFKLVPDLGEREDWFSSVDGFTPSLGMGIAVFDHTHFNHAFIAGHVSYKAASERAGYALGFERPIFAATKLYVGGELHDLTASDDMWRASSIEASLSAVGPRRSLRDYYRRRGYQINTALRLHSRIEALAAWRSERQEALATTSDFSFWNSDEPFRTNASALDGRLNALVVGASADSHGFERESLEASYRRHQLEAPFGAWLDDADSGRDSRPIWRIDWTSEISDPGAFSSDFDFRRHIVSGRARALLTEHQRIGVRAIRGWSGGVLPPQRLFAIGGYGSVHGYEFKEAVGDAMTLLNLEYELGWRRGFKVIGFYDVGRVQLEPGRGSPWLKGVGIGAGAGGFRVDFGYKTSAIPSSLQVLIRFDRTF
jgi:outer membrane protein assembly factor BamA